MGASSAVANADFTCFTTIVLSVVNAVFYRTVDTSFGFAIIHIHNSHFLSGFAP